MNIPEHLICPITLNLLEDPVSVPCCGQTFSRSSIKDVIKFRNDCPLCNQAWNFDPDSLAKNIIVVQLIDEFNNVRKHNLVKPTEIWNCLKYPIIDLFGKNTNVSLLRLTVENSLFTLSPTLFIVVCDSSGSMGGNPWSQVENALLYMIEMSKTSHLIEMAVVVYSSGARIVDPKTLTKENIRHQFDSGGTNFDAAFEKIFEILRGQKNKDYNSAVVAFLTDGQGSNPDGLIVKLKEMVNNVNNWNKPLTVHSIGFGECDKIFLENIRLSGTKEGIFRYSDSNENIDTLSRKITDLFDIVLRIVEAEILVNNRQVFLKIKEDGSGSAELWMNTDEKEDDIKITLINNNHREQIVPIQIMEPGISLFSKWVMYQVEETAKLFTQIQSSPTALSVLEQRLRNMEKAGIEGTLDNIHFLFNQIENLKKGANLELGKLYDMRFSSAFAKNNKAHSNMKGKDLEIKEKIISHPLLDDVPYFEQSLKHYSRNNLDTNRNSLQEFVMSINYNCECKNLEQYLSLENFIHVDIHKNNIFHLLAYCGHSKIIAQIGKYMKENGQSLELTKLVNSENIHYETAMTISIKKRGFHKSLSHLHSFGGVIPVDRIKSLQRYCIENCYNITTRLIENLAKIEVNYDNFIITMDMAKSMTPEYIMFIYEKCNQKEQFFNIALSKKMLDFAKKVHADTNYIPSYDSISYCFPKKCDSDEVEDYNELLRFVDSINPELVKNNLILIQAVESGNLPSVKLVISLRKRYFNLAVDARNELGNTALWIACAKKYPCIVDELLLEGADPNSVNLKGNSPLYPIAQLGPVKSAINLIKSGANVEIINSNGDTLVLIACRNGRDDVLEVFLNYVDLEFVDRKAHIDGFNAIFASVESNRPACIRKLHEYGVDLNQKTDGDNKILANATPLHLAAFYNCKQAAETLIELGCKMDEESNGFTALQIAAIQNNYDIALLLVNRGANKKGSAIYARDKIRELLLENLIIDSYEDVEKYWSIYWNNVDVSDENENTLLTHAVLEGDVKRIENICLLGGNPMKKNAYGLTPHDYAFFLKNKRTIKILEQYGECRTNENLKKLQIRELFLTNRSIPLLDYESLFKQRMRISLGEINHEENKSSLVSITASLSEELNWLTRFNTINRLAIKIFENISDQLIISLYTLTDFSHESELFHTYLMDVVSSLPDYEGETFVKTDRYNEGTVLSINKTLSGSSLWRMVTQEFNVRSDTISIFNGGKFIGGKFAEVIILPGRYKVEKWYHYDPICLNQSNIRDTTFRIREIDIIKAIVMKIERV